MIRVAPGILLADLKVTLIGRILAFVVTSCNTVLVLSFSRD